MYKINKKIFILLVAVLSLTSFTMGVKAATITDENDNHDRGGKGDGTGYPPTTLREGAAQILKLRVFGSDGTLKKTGYINISDTTSSISGTVCGLKDDENKIFLIDGKRKNQSLYSNSGLFQCKSDKTISLKNIGQFQTPIWGFWYSNAGSLSNWIKEDKYDRLIKMLEAIDYKDWDNSDYVIVEPFLSVTCNSKNTYGTITALMERNIGFDGNMYDPSNRKYQGVKLACGGTNTAPNYTATNLRQLYSVVAESFKSKSGYTCIPNDSPTHYNPSVTSDFSGCGYNRYNISDIIKNGSLTITKKFKPYKKDLYATFKLYTSKTECTANGKASYSKKVTATKEGGDTIKFDGLKIGTTYYLKEIPGGTGTLSSHYKAYESNGKTFEQCQAIKITKDNMNPKKTVVNKAPIAIKIKKVDASGNALADAKLELQIPNGKDWKPIKSWTTKIKGKTKNNPLTHTEDVAIGKTYRLVETEAPDKYFKALPIKFTLPNQIDKDSKTKNYTWDSNLGRFVYTVTMEDERIATIKVRKVNSSDVLITSSQAKFRLYTDSSCTEPYNSTEYSTTAGILTVNNLHSGDALYVKETKAPTGYHASDECLKVTAKKTWITSEIPKIKNRSECEYDFDTLTDKQDMLKRIELYNTKYSNYNGLLDLGNKTSVTACKPVNCNVDTSVKCLTGTHGYYGTFNEQNLSCYNRKLTSSSNVGIFGYCNVTFDLNPVGFGAQFKNNHILGNSVSGELYLSRNETNKIIASGTLTKTCYTFGSSKNESIPFDTNGNYIAEFKLDNNALTTNVGAASETSTSVANGNFMKRVIKKTYSYSLNDLSSKRGTGEIGESSNSNLLGYGLASKFSDNGKITVPFSIKINGNIYTDNCYYTATPQLVCPPDKCGGNWELNLEFRQISKSNPFPGKSGTGREVGSNWCDGINCYAEGNKTIKDTITDKNDSYNSTGEGAKYIINLNSETIQQIKNKNKNQAYDDFGVNCSKESGTCANNFIDWMKSQGILKEG